MIDDKRRVNLTLLSDELNEARGFYRFKGLKDAGIVKEVFLIGLEALQQGKNCEVGDVHALKSQIDNIEADMREVLAITKFKSLGLDGSQKEATKWQER